MPSKADLTKGYWRIPVAAENVYKTVFVTPNGQYEFLRMPFGGLKKILDRLSGADHHEASEILPRIETTSQPLSNLLNKGKSEQVQCNEAQEHAYSLLQGVPATRNSTKAS